MINFLEGADESLTDSVVRSEISGNDATSGENIVRAEIAHDDNIFVDGEVLRINALTISDNSGVVVEDNLVEIIIGIGSNNLFFDIGDGAGVTKKHFFFEFLANVVFSLIEIFLNGIFNSFLKVVFSLFISGGTVGGFVNG